MRSRLVATVLFGLAMIPALLSPVLPLVDFYNHLARFHVLAHRSSAVLQNNYEVYWSPISDIGGDLTGVPLLLLFPPLVAGHLIVAIILAIFSAGVLYLNSGLMSGRISIPVAVLLLPLLLSRPRFISMPGASISR